MVSTHIILRVSILSIIAFANSFLQSWSIPNYLHLPCFQQPKQLVEGSLEWEYIKHNPTETLRNHLFKMNESTFSAQAVELAMKYGADVNTNALGLSRIMNCTLLHYAADIERPDIVKWLLEHGASHEFCSSPQMEDDKPNCYTSFSPLSYYSTNTKAMQACLDHFPEVINMREQNGFTPLHLAASNRHAHSDTIVTLFEAKPSQIRTPCFDGLLPLHVACKGGNQGIVQFLLQCYPQGLHAKTTHGFTPIHIAAFHNHVGLVKYLIDSDPRIRIKGWDNTFEEVLRTVRNRTHQTEMIDYLQQLKEEMIRPKLSPLEQMECLLGAGASTKLTIQCILGNLPNAFPHSLSLLTESNADPKKVAFLSSLFRPSHPEYTS